MELKTMEAKKKKMNVRKLLKAKRELTSALATLDNAIEAIKASSASLEKPREYSLCKECSNSFLSVGNNKVFCSAECLKKFYKKYRADYQRENKHLVRKYNRASRGYKERRPA
jgi:protein-arginine kinase activator protein McsA